MQMRYFDVLPGIEYQLEVGDTLFGDVALGGEDQLADQFSIFSFGLGHSLDMLFGNDQEMLVGCRVF